MAIFYFAHRSGVDDPPLSMVAIRGEMNESESSRANIIAQEYGAVCGDICEHPNKRDEVLYKLRDELTEAGHELVLSTDPLTWVGRLMFTDYPFIDLGDKPHSVVQIRECRVVSYDGDKYCVVDINGKQLEVKAGYLRPTEKPL